MTERAGSVHQGVRWVVSAQKCAIGKDVPFGEMFMPHLVLALDDPLWVSRYKTME